MKFSERIFEENIDLWQKYLEHPFILGMKDASLNIDAFRYYLLQDYHYLIDYTKVFAIGLSKANSPEDIANFSKSISGISWEIENVHLKYMERIGIPKEEVAKSKPSLSNTSYTSYMIAKAHQGDMINAYAAVLSCSWSYAFIGKNLAEMAPNLINDNVYGDWIAAYSSQEYQEMNEDLIQLFDNKCSSLSSEKLDELAEIFRLCSEYELRFWDMAYSMGESDKSDCGIKNA